MLIKDTYKAINDLKEAGLPPEQAERIVGLFQEADEQVATRHDVELLRKDIEALCKEMHSEVDKLREEMGVLRKEMHSEIDKLREEMGVLRKEMHSEIDKLRKDMKLNVYAVGLAIAGLMAAFELL